MINVTPQVRQVLSTIGLKVYDENFLDDKSEIPCITIREYDNKDYILVDILEYSDISYHIKVWAKSQADLVTYSKQVDTIMRQNGFKRTVVNDLWTNNIGQRDMKFVALGLEKF